MYNISIQWTFLVSMVIFLRVTQKNKIDLVENRFRKNISIFFLNFFCFSGVLKTTENLNFAPTRFYLVFSTGKDTEDENQTFLILCYFN